MSLSLVTATGSYIGNGTSQAIAIGWQPAFVWMVNNATTGPSSRRCLVYKTATMVGAEFFLLTAGGTSYETAGGITLTSTGFSVGSVDGVNRSGLTYYWTAIRAGPHFDVGSYAGDGQATQNIATGRQPCAGWLVQSTGTVAGSVHPGFGPTMFRFSGTSVTRPDMMTFISTGFSVEGNANVSGQTYHYALCYCERLATIYTRFNIAYSGNGAGTQAVALGGQPKSLHTTHFLATIRVPVKSASMNGDDLGDVVDGSGYSWMSPGANQGIQILSTGIQIGGAIYNGFAEQYRMATLMY